MASLGLELIIHLSSEDGCSPPAGVEIFTGKGRQQPLRRAGGLAAASQPLSPAPRRGPQQQPGGVCCAGAGSPVAGSRGGLEHVGMLRSWFGEGGTQEGLGWWRFRTPSARVDGAVPKPQGPLLLPSRAGCDAASPLPAGGSLPAATGWGVLHPFPRRTLCHRETVPAGCATGISWLRMCLCPRGAALGGTAVTRPVPPPGAAGLDASPGFPPQLIPPSRAGAGERASG